MNSRLRFSLFIIICFSLTYIFDRFIVHLLQVNHVVNIRSHEVLDFGLWILFCAVITYLVGPFFTKD